MKLRNKKTGEIGNLVLNINPNRESYSVLSTENGDTVCGNLVLADYDSLAELNAEWEDYEEPKEYWYIDPMVCGVYCTKIEKDEDLYDFNKQIGNYFETKEDAEKAVEKLKAWKRLKDKGFRFDGYDVAHNSNGDLCGQLFYNAGDYCIEDVEKDLDLLFGGEE